MIRHIIFFGAKDPADREAIYDGLSLLKGISSCMHLEIGRNFRTDQISKDAPDFVVYSEFVDEAQLAAFKAHPLYAKSIEVVRPLRDMRVAADFFAA